MFGLVPQVLTESLQSFDKHMLLLEFTWNKQGNTNSYVYTVSEFGVYFTILELSESKDTEEKQRYK